ncbi:hypothetical protein J1N35_044316 [Gossypium stocksii]|uniref:Uncharacterized protein n=1 Tax=Gossypium stocksii TaxID=47602 RepID=A0A9D3U913_9ROSI|nr:hypothetical protein J1N35_044316 [Gossypium stocksii]
MCVALSRRGLLPSGFDGWWKGGGYGVYVAVFKPATVTPLLFIVKGWLLPSVRVADGGSSECRTLLYGVLMGCTRSTVPT